MHCQQAAVQDEKHILAFAIDGSNAAGLRFAGDLRSCLRLRGDGVKNVNATDPPIPDEGTERADDSFNFRKLKLDRKSTRLNSSHQIISYAVFCLKKKNHKVTPRLASLCPM